MSSKKEANAQSPSTSSRRRFRLKRTNKDKSTKQVNSSKSTKSAKSPRNGHSKKKDVEKEAGPQAQAAEASTKAPEQKKDSQRSIRRLIPSISPKAFRRRWSSLRGRNVQNGNDSDRSHKNVPPAAANQSNLQSKVVSIPQPSTKAKEQPLHPQSKQANKNLQPSEKERLYVDRLLKRNSDDKAPVPVSAQVKDQSKKQQEHSTSSKKNKKVNSEKLAKTDSKKSQKKPKVVEAKVAQPQQSPSPSKAPSSTPKSQKVVKKEVKAKSPFAVAVKPSPVTSSPNTPRLPPVPSRTPRRYCHSKDEVPGSVVKVQNPVPDAKTPLKSPPAPNTTPTPTPNVKEEKEDDSSDESESEHSINADEVLEQERNAGQKPEELQPVKVTKPPKVIVRPGEPLPMDKENADRIAKLRANAPKPKPQPKNAKEAKIHENRIFKLKHDYPTMNDVLSDWDSADEAKVHNEKKKKNSQSPEKNLK
ncbi:hypothetical protein M3Y95_00726400 [Aphelenchoides besseyi]|nr:hypothetical protein M3Y95_00726400 [Aphelenchoides besseyi]